jgi:hypothetical protein
LAATGRGKRKAGTFKKEEKGRVKWGDGDRNGWREKGKREEGE